MTTTPNPRIEPDNDSENKLQISEELGSFQYQFFVDSATVSDYHYMVPPSSTSIGNLDAFTTAKTEIAVANVGLTDKQIFDVDGALLSYPLWQILPDSVVYANGARVTFAYDETGEVIRITEEPGCTWTKDNSLKAPTQFKRWLRNDGKVFDLKVSVLPDGNYQLMYENGDVLNCTTAGKRLLSRPLPENFDLQQSLARVFKVLDVDGSGLLDKGRINRGVLQHWSNNDDAQLVTMLKLHYEVIQITREKSIFKIGKGVSKEEILQYDSANRKIQSKDNPALILKTVNALFDAIDTNQDQNISMEEIVSSFESGKAAAGQTVSLSYIIQHSQKLHAFTKNGYVDRTTRMTRDEFIQHYCEVYKEQVLKFQKSGGWGIEQLWQQTMEAKRTLYGSMQRPHESLRIEAIKQGRVGDCLFLAALASIISVRPGVIMQTIIPNDNGTYTVTFLGAPESPVAVMPPTSSELALYAKGSEFGIWAPLMEKAYGLLVAKRRNLTTVIPAENTATRENMKSLEIIGGRQSRWEYTQDSVSRALGVCKQSMNEKELRNLLINCFAQNRAIIAAALKGSPQEGLEPSICGMHAYSVIAFDANENIVTMRNPWGIVSKQGVQTELFPICIGKPLIDDGTQGIFKLPLASFARKFEGLCVESK